MTNRKQEVLDSDPTTGTYRATYAYPSEPPSIAVPLAVMEVADCDATDLEPLYEAGSVDPDALDELFRPAANADRRDCRVSFAYHGYTVVVKSYGRIVVRRAESDQSRPSTDSTNR